jgi:hypothetical protein
MYAGAGQLTVTGVTSPVTADTYTITTTVNNNLPTFKSNTLGTPMYVWADVSGFWYISSAIGSQPSAYFSASSHNALVTYNASGTATGTPAVAQNILYTNAPANTTAGLPVAHGWYLKGTYNDLNLVALIRCQCNLDAQAATIAQFGTPMPCGFQRVLNVDVWSGAQQGPNAGVLNTSMVQHDFEWASNAPTNTSGGLSDAFAPYGLPLLPNGPGTYIDMGGIFTYDGLSQYPLRPHIVPSANKVLMGGSFQYTQIPYFDNVLGRVPSQHVCVYPGALKLPRPAPFLQAASGFGGMIYDSVAQKVVTCYDNIGWDDTYAVALPASLSALGTVLLDLNFADAGFSTGQITTFTPTSVSDGLGSTGVGGVCTGVGTTHPQWLPSTTNPTSVGTQKKGVYFNGSTSYFSCTTTVPAGAFTDIILLYLPTLGVNGTYNIIAGNTGGSPEIYISSQALGSNPYIQMASSSVAGILSTLSGGWLVPMNQWVMLTIAYDPTTNHNCIIRVNSTPFITIGSLTTTFTGTNTTQIGASSAGNILLGNIARLVRFSGQLSTNNILGAEQYLRKWCGGGV